MRAFETSVVRRGGEVGRAVSSNAGHCVYYYCLQRCERELKEITRHALQRACEKGRSAAACFQLELLSPTEMEKSGAHFFLIFRVAMYNAPAGNVCASKIQYRPLG